MPTLPFDRSDAPKGVRYALMVALAGGLIAYGNKLGIFKTSPVFSFSLTLAFVQIQISL
jgi:hypothetical protein